MLHHHLEHFSLGESSLHLHADNCSGQNKNRYVLEYLAWRVLAGLQEEVELSFLIVGHTKYSPDWCFGLFKRAFKRTKVGCLDDLVNVCEGSAKVNKSQLVGTQDGTVVVPTYNWSAFFQPFFKANPFKGLKKLQHLRFTATHPGACFFKETPDGEERMIAILRDPYWRPSSHVLAPVIPPQGLSAERQQYLYEKIRDFCPPHCKDIVCPRPTGAPRPPPRSPSTSPPTGVPRPLPRSPPPSPPRRAKRLCRPT